MWAQYAEAQLKEAARLEHTKEWAEWSGAMAPGVKFYVQNFRSSGYHDVCSSKVGLGWKFYDMPFEVLSPCYSETSQYGYARTLMAPLGMEMHGIECELDMLAREMRSTMKFVCRIMGQRKRRGFDPWPGRKATQYRRPYDGGLPG